MQNVLRLLPSLLALLLGGLAQAQDAAPELLKNPGFDDDADRNGLPDNWSTSDKSVQWREKAALGQDYEVVSRPGAYVLATQDVTLKPGQRYTVTLRMKGEGGARGGALILHGLQEPRAEFPIMWNVEVSDEYEDYVGSFAAPNPACRLYIYNVARQGTIRYDRVSLYEGEPNQVTIQQLGMAEADRPREAPFVTPHVQWASPLAGGPIRAFCTWRHLDSAREMYEFAQRLDLDYDLVETGYEGDHLCCDTARRARKTLKEGAYEVYVIPSRVPDLLAKTIREKVEAGAGLVVVEGFGQAGKFLKPETLQVADDTHFIREGIPWAMIPENILSSVQVGTLGKGRVVRLNFPLDKVRAWGILPAANDRVEYHRRQCAYWEWWFSLLAKAVVWAANREGTAGLAVTQATPDQFTLKAANAPPGAKVRVVRRSGRELRFATPPIREEPADFALDGQGLAQVPVPDAFPAGPVIADAMLLNAQQVLAWGSFVTTRPQAARLVSLTAEPDVLEPAQPVVLHVKMAAEAAQTVEVRTSIIDAFGRVVAATAASKSLPTAGETELVADLPAWHPLCVQHKAFVQIVIDGREQDSGWTRLRVPKMGPELAAADFTVTCWSQGMLHPEVQGFYGRRLKELGLNAGFAGDLALAGESGLVAAAYVSDHGMFRVEDAKDGIRPRCLSDPATIKRYTDVGHKSAADQRPEGPFAVGIGDELLLSPVHKLQEVCFCPLCQARFRTWLQSSYHTLDTLNQEWGSAWKSWDDVRGATTADVRGKTNFAPFVDFRTFMTDYWIEGLRGLVTAYHETTPEIPVGHTNTFGPNPFNGNDFWKLSTQCGYGWSQEYSEAIKGEGSKAVFDIWRSFVDTPEALAARRSVGQRSDVPFFAYGWVGYDRRPIAAHYEPWWLALHGSRGVSYYAAASFDTVRGNSWSLLYPSLAFTDYSKAVQETLQDLRAGCGKVLLEYTRERPAVALLYSDPSLHVAWCESTWPDQDANERDGCDSYGCYHKSHLRFRQHLNELQLDCNYLAPDQIMKGDVLSQYRVLYLPFTVAVAPALVEKFESYLNQGGVLIGDLRCIRTDEHGKPFPDSSLLARLFGVDRGQGQMDYGKTKVTFTDTVAGLDLRGKEVELYGRESLTAAGAVALARHATGEPAVLVRRHGQGLSVYLNFMLPSYDVTTRELIRRVIEIAGVKSAVTVENPAGGPPPRCWERDTFMRGPITVHGFIRDHRRCTDTDPARVRFGQASHVYDMRAGKYLGQTDTVEMTLPPGETALFSCLPYQVAGLRITAPAQVKAGSDLTVQLTLDTGQATAGDHIIHLEFLDPQGQAQWHYARNLLAPGGKFDFVLPLALNEIEGPWRLWAQDVLSGTTGEATFEVTPK